MGGKISAVQEDSIGAELGIEPGDILLAINDEPVRDLIDYNFHSSDEYLELTIEKADGEVWVCEVDKYADEELGLAFTASVFDGIRPCGNRCLFCFIDQLHPQPRPTLLLKDDDFRMSFLSGNYITCTNMSDADYQRIAEQRLSPLYISVHSIDPQLRQKLLGRREPAEILLTMQRLIALGCRLHTQIVLCPGINDGAALDATLDALTALRPGVVSIAVVPVGLTRFQRHKELRLFRAEEAAAVIDNIEARQSRCADGEGNFVYASDEFYIRAGRDFPAAGVYGDFCQLENGVGMAALFRRQYQEARKLLLSSAPDAQERLGIITGQSGAVALDFLKAEFAAQGWHNISIVPLTNSFFGPTVTVSGLLTGSCLLQGVAPGSFDRLLLPASMLKFDRDIFLDDTTPEQISAQLGIELTLTECNAAALLQAICAH